MAEGKLNHLAIIMDGNGRWAEAQGKPRVFGHSEGVNALRLIVAGVVKRDIGYLTVYAFSYENWGRPKGEVSYLMGLFDTYIDAELDSLNKEGVKLRFIGELDVLSQKIRDKIKKAEELTADNLKLVLTVAISYSARKEIVSTVNRLIDEGVKEISEDTFSEALYTKDIPNPDLVVRTSGEKRLSNFLLWQLAYAEIMFMDKHWPDFREEDIDLIVDEYKRRNRRYGKVKE